MISIWTQKHVIFRKLISLTACVAFFILSVAPDAASAVYSTDILSGISSPKEAEFAELDIETFTIPEHLGEIRYKHNALSNKFVVHLQDAHCNAFAQHKIAGLIDYINREYGIETVNLEGGVGEYDLDVFTSISGKEIRREVADYFVKTGEINGAEYYAANNPSKITLWGIEDKELYLKNLKIYRDSLLYKDEVNEFLKILTHILNNLKRHIYPRNLLKVDMAYNSYKSGNMEFRDYLNFLIETAKQNGILIKKFTNVYLIGQAMQMEERIDFKKANIERNILVDELKKGLSRNEIKKLVANTVDFKTKKISRKTFYNFLLEKAREIGVKVEQFPALSDYIVYISLYEAVDHSEVMEELFVLEERIKEPLFKNNIQRGLDILSRNLALMKNIFQILITRVDYRYYLNNKNSFEVSNYKSFITGQGPKYKIDVSPSDNITKLDFYREKIAEFYEYSFKRDEAFLNNMRFDREKQSGQKATILMTGGFHTQNLCELFKEKGISYISILPKFTSDEDYVSPYFEILAGQTTNLESMLTSVLARASMMQIASKLNNILGEAVYGRDGMTTFDAAVRLREMMVRIMFQEGEKGQLVRNPIRVALRDGEEEIYAEGEGRLTIIQVRPVLEQFGFKVAEIKDKALKTPVERIEEKTMLVQGENIVESTETSKKDKILANLKQSSKILLFLGITAFSATIISCGWSKTSPTDLSSEYEVVQEEDISLNDIYIKIVDDIGISETDISDLKTSIRDSARYMEDMGFDYSLPENIYLGDNGKGNYTVDNDWYISNINFEVISAKLIQLSLINVYPNLGYTALEAYSEYYLDKLMIRKRMTSRISTSDVFVYNPDFEELTGNDISKAYDDYNAGIIDKSQLDETILRVINNFRAIAQIMRDISLELDGETADRITQDTLDLLLSTMNPSIDDILDAFLEIDNNITGGANTQIIQQVFNKHMPVISDRLQVLGEREPKPEGEPVPRPKDEPLIPEAIDKTVLSKEGEIDEIAEACKQMLYAANPGKYPSVVAIEVSKEQMFFDGSKYTKLKKSTERVLFREYGVNIHVIYFLAEAVDEMTEMIKNPDKIKGFKEDDMSRVIVFADESSYERVKQSVTGFGDKLAGVVKGNFLSRTETERFSIVALSVFGLGLIEWHRDDTAKRPTNKMEEYLRDLLMRLVNNPEAVINYITTECKNNANLFLENLLKGIFFMAIRKINYEEIRDYMEAQSAVLESL
ncbi:MAG: hypothetical protein ABH869_04420 [Candidatus Omnitrophota bacterium]